MIITLFFLPFQTLSNLGILSAIEIILVSNIKDFNLVKFNLKFFIHFLSAHLIFLLELKLFFPEIEEMRIVYRTKHYSKTEHNPVIYSTCWYVHYIF